jgi:hypothetical protein
MGRHWWQEVAVDRERVVELVDEEGSMAVRLVHQHLADAGE